MAARMLGPGGQGELAVYNNLILFGGLLLSMGLPAALVRYLAGGLFLPQQFTAVLRWVGGIGLGFVVLLLLLVKGGVRTVFLPAFFYQHISWLFMASLHLLMSVGNGLLTAVLQSAQRFNETARISILGSLVLLVIYALRFTGILGTQVAPCLWIIASLPLSAVLLFGFYVRSVYRLDSRYFLWEAWDGKAIRPLFVFAALAFATNGIQFMSYRMDIWFLTYYQGAEVTGVYALSVSLAQMLWLLPSAVQSVIYSELSGDENRIQMRQKTIKACRQMGIYAIGGGLIGAVLAVYLLPYLFGQAYSEGVSIIHILLFGIVPFCISMPVSAYFAATGRLSYNLHSAILGFGVCFILDILWVPQGGMAGAAWASVLSYLVTLLYLLIRFFREAN